MKKLLVLIGILSSCAALYSADSDLGQQVGTQSGHQVALYYIDRSQCDSNRTIKIELSEVAHLAPDVRDRYVISDSEGSSVLYDLSRTGALAYVPQRYFARMIVSQEQINQLQRLSDGAVCEVAGFFRCMKLVASPDALRTVLDYAACYGATDSEAQGAEDAVDGLPSEQVGQAATDQDVHDPAHDQLPEDQEMRAQSARRAFMSLFEFDSARNAHFERLEELQKGLVAFGYKSDYKALSMLLTEILRKYVEVAGHASSAEDACLTTLPGHAFLSYIEEHGWPLEPCEGDYAMSCVTAIYDALKDVIEHINNKSSYPLFVFERLFLLLQAHCVAQDEIWVQKFLGNSEEVSGMRWSLEHGRRSYIPLTIKACKGGNPELITWFFTPARYERFFLGMYGGCVEPLAYLGRQMPLDQRAKLYMFWQGINAKMASLLLERMKLDTDERISLLTSLLAPILQAGCNPADALMTRNDTLYDILERHQGLSAPVKDQIMKMFDAAAQEHALMKERLLAESKALQFREDLWFSVRCLGKLALGVCICSYSIVTGLQQDVDARAKEVFESWWLGSA